MPIFGFLSMLSFAAKQKLKSSYTRGSIMRPYDRAIPLVSADDWVHTTVSVNLAIALVDCFICPSCLSELHAEICEHCSADHGPICDLMEAMALHDATKED